MFRIIGENIKVHWVSEPVLAVEVLQNLKERHRQEYAIADVSKKTELWYDPGNTFLTDAEPLFTFRLPNFALNVRSQHWFDFREEVRKHLADDDRSCKLYDGLFFKLHNENSVICLSLGERDEILAEVGKNEEKYSKIARLCWKHMGGAFHDEEVAEEYLLKQQGKIINLSDRRR